MGRMRFPSLWLVNFGRLRARTIGWVPHGHGCWLHVRLKIRDAPGRQGTRISGSWWSSRPGSCFIYQAWPWPESQFVRGSLAFLPLAVRARSRSSSHVEFKYHLFGVLFLIPIVYGSLTLSWPGGIFAWCLALIWVLPTLLSWSNASTGSISRCSSCPCCSWPSSPESGGGARARGATSPRREQERQAYIAKLVETQEAERRRIAQELHDETLQTLMVIANKSDALASSAPTKSRSRATCGSSRKCCRPWTTCGG